ncbi:hypothetical protein [Jiella avicenniae]|uniref:Uncharacterized protein n=1 Tax=Jiella avicenniae TaxID=2907202 RepID=A0A9X1P1P3_9HYPH|nr:hypothetical protein [Jiella avicenniae]MCE7028471.1 hypothetical protein [Jiella avicenniae]
MEDWAAIAAEVESALVEIADVSQPAGYPVTIRRVTAGNPYDPDDDGTKTYHAFHCVQETRQFRDASGSLVGESITTLLLNATGDITPSEADTILPGTKKADIEALPDAAADALGWQEIGDVREVSPAGVPVLFEVDLAN